MADKEFTLFELRFDGDLQLGPVFGGGAEEKPDADDVEEAAAPDLDLDVESGGPGPVAGLLALGLLVAVALAVRRLLGGDDGAEDIDGETIEEIESA